MKPKKLEIGDKVKWIQETRHIIAFLEDDNEPLVVFKVWSPARGWRYNCELLEIFLFNICLNEDYSFSKRKELFKLNGLEYE